VPGGPAETVAPEDEPAHRLLVADDADSAVPAAAVSAVSAVTEQHVTQTQTALGGRCSVLVQDIPDWCLTTCRNDVSGDPRSHRAAR